jgi:MoaA/NifB/PqqE/SkfB family radical SAM enzyme
MVDFLRPVPPAVAPTLAVQADLKFDENFRGRLIQVFFYVTDECNIRCEQCYYKPWLKRGNAEINTNTALALLKKMRELGAVKVSFLGGEPTLYGKMEGNEPLSHLVAAARVLGFEYVRIVTNGLFGRTYLEDPLLRFADEITFSIDGDTAEIHDKLRGRRTFDRAVRNIVRASQLGHTVHLTMCAHRGNIGRTANGELVLSRSIKWAADLGVKSFNIHPLFRMGVPRDSWTGETDIDPTAWLKVYQEIRDAVRRGDYKIPVRLPPRFTNPQGFGTQEKLFGYCSVKRADRLDIHPNGKIHTCALHTGTNTAVACFVENDNLIRITWQRVDNETTAHSFDKHSDHPCRIMKGFPADLVPLCISLKPGQDEFAWKRIALE